MHGKQLMLHIKNDHIQLITWNRASNDGDSLGEDVKKFIHTFYVNEAMHS